MQNVSSAWKVARAVFIAALLMICLTQIVSLVCIWTFESYGASFTADSITEWTVLLCLALSWVGVLSILGIMIGKRRYCPDSPPLLAE